MDKSEEEEIAKVAVIFENLGAGVEQSRVMAGQLIKRAEQVAEERKISKIEALETLLKQVIEARQGAG